MCKIHFEPEISFSSFISCIHLWIGRYQSTTSYIVKSSPQFSNYEYYFTTLNYSSIYLKKTIILIGTMHTCFIPLIAQRLSICACTFHTVTIYKLFVLLGLRLTFLFFAFQNSTRQDSRLQIRLKLKLRKKHSLWSQVPSCN